MKDASPAAAVLRPQVWGAIAFTAGYLLLATVAAFVTGNREFLFYLVVMLVLVALVAWLHLRQNLSNLALWGLSVWGLAHMAGGLLPVPAKWPIDGDIAVLYSLWLVPGWFKFDHLVHAYGFGIATLVCWELLQTTLARLTPRARSTLAPTFGLLTLCGLAAMGLGALNEIVEFVATLLVPETNVGGYINTGWDLVANLAGVVAAVLLLKKFARP